jgi:hypothetical protein
MWKKPEGAHPATLSELIFDETGRPESNILNLSKVFKTDPKYKNKFRLDTFNQRTNVFDQTLNTGLVTQICLDVLDRYGLNLSLRDIRNVARVLAEDQPYHPVKDYLRNLVWDGVPRLHDLMLLGFGCSKRRVQTVGRLEELGKNLCVSMVARIMNPTRKTEDIVVLRGVQGSRKSAALAELCPKAEWYCNIPARVTDRDFWMTIQGKWLYEVSDIETLSKKEQEALKVFASARSHTVRPPFQFETVEVHRETSFLATTCDTSFEDETSPEPRYILADVKVSNPSWIVANRDQLWAEAVVLYAKGETGEHLRALPEADFSFGPVALMHDDWAHTILERILSRDCDGFYSVERILTRWLNMPEKAISRAERIRVCQLMREMGISDIRLQQPKVMIAQGYTSPPRGYWINDQTRKRLAVKPEAVMFP